MTDEDLYADIDADDTDAQKAAHWMVEQELMKFDEDIPTTALSCNPKLRLDA